MQKRMMAIGLVTVGLLAGCATPTVVEVKQTGDEALSCAQIKDQLEQAEKYQQAAKKDRTVTGTNVAAAIFFLPGLLGTYVNTEEAINAAKERQVLLNNLAQKKKCNLDAIPTASSAQDADGKSTESPKNTAPALASKSDQLFKPMTTMEVQKQLLALGYQAGTPDGVIGKRTVDALKKFQHDNNLPQNGQADSETASMLRQKTVNTSAK